MTNHVKPTKEELDAAAAKALADAEAAKKKIEEAGKDPEDLNIDDDDDDDKNKDGGGEGDDDNHDGEGEDDDDKGDDDDDKDDDKGDDEGDDDKDNPPAKTPEEIKKELEEKEKKLKASSQEAIVLHSTNKKIQESINKAAELPKPTDDEMKAVYPNWDELDDFSQNMARESLWNTRKMETITSVSKEFKDYEAWETKVNGFVDDPATLANNPDLEGKTTEFKAFAMKPTRRNADFEDLVKAFLFDAKTERKNMPKKKGNMMENKSGANGKHKPANSGKITIEQAATLRKTDYRKYQEYVRSGKIDYSGI